MNNLQCPECNATLKLTIGYTGMDWESKAGEGSGFGHEMSLNCTNDRCTRVFTLGYLRNEYDFSPVRG